MSNNNSPSSSTSSNHPPPPPLFYQPQPQPQPQPHLFYQPQVVRIHHHIIYAGFQQEQEQEQEQGAAEVEEEEDAQLEIEVVNRGARNTELCRYFSRYGMCNNGVNCPFAHGVTELRRVTTRHRLYRTRWCSNFIQGRPCTFGHRCSFRHY